MMNEQDIIKYLKENKNKGVAFAFMPREVGIWCCEHRNEEIFHMFYYSSWNGKCSINCRDNAIYCLDEDYEPKPETHYKELDKEREEMNEKEIVNYLKDNRIKGASFDFMPEDVRIWCKLHKDDPIFNVYFSDGWNYTKTGITCQYSGIYCLPEDYKPKPEFKPHYEEFEIDKDGFFRIKKESYTYYCWFNWQKFLDDNFDKYNNFGGWVYEDPAPDGKKIELLVTSPCIIKSGRSLASCLPFNNCKYDIEPARPTKILFWRYRE